MLGRNRNVYRTWACRLRYESERAQCDIPLDGPEALQQTPDNLLYINIVSQTSPVCSDIMLRKEEDLLVQ
jgi:hypothetical protein